MKAGAGQVGVPQIDAFPGDVGQAGVAEVGTMEVGAAQRRAGEERAGEGRRTEIAGAQLDLLQIAGEEVGFAKNRAVEPAVAQADMAQVRSR